MLAEGGDPDHVPPTIQALLAARLDSLPEEEREVLERASIVGLEFEWEALAALSPGRRRPPGAQLAALVRKELIRPHEAIEDAFRFRHMMIRDAAYERIPKELRSELHEAFAGRLGGSGEGLDEVVGYHLEQAYLCLAGLGRPGERARALADQAAERLAASGQRAHAHGDSRAAVNLLERATGLLQADDPRRLRLLPLLGRGLREQGRLDQADAVLVEAGERGRAAGELAVAADAGVTLAEQRFHRPTQTGVGREDVLREIEAAIKVFDEVGDDAGLARALTLRGKTRLWAGEAAAALPDFASAAQLTHNQAEVTDSLQYMCLAFRVGPTPAEEALRQIEELRSRAVVNARLDEAMLVARALLMAARGDFGSARVCASEARALAEEHGLDGTRAQFAQGCVELIAGDAAAAERDLRPVCEHFEQIGELGYLSTMATHLVDAVAAQGRYDEALLLTERWRADRLTVPEDTDAQSNWRRVRAKVLARTGELGEAERLGRDAVAIASATDNLELRADALGDLGEILGLGGNLRESRDALEEALRLYEAKGFTVGAERLRALLAERPIEA
jgi:tetratricopeptide (TPR) repeat protein